MRQIFTLALATALLTGCAKDPDISIPAPRRPILPLETMTGANTFGALVSDSIWECAYQPSQGIVSASPNARYSRRKLSVFALRRAAVNSPAAYFDIEMDSVPGPGTYTLRATQGLTGRIRYAVLGTLESGVDYVTDNSTATGTVTITRLDTTSRARFVSGRFALRALKRVSPIAPANAGATLPAELRVVSGRFDVQMDRP